MVCVALCKQRPMLFVSYLAAVLGVSHCTEVTPIFLPKVIIHC